MRDTERERGWDRQIYIDEVKYRLKSSERGYRVWSPAVYFMLLYCSSLLFKLVSK